MSENVEAVAESPETSKTDAQHRHSKQRRGIVVSAKMNKTVIVRVDRRIKHPKYKKYVTVRKRYAAHDIIGVSEGDKVLIQESRPISKTIRWRVLRKLELGA